MASSPPYAPFLLAQKAKGYHVAVHPADSRLDPPESYLLVQTLLILFTAILWTMAYFFYSIRTFRDHKSAMPLYCLYVLVSEERRIRCTDQRHRYGNMAWELFYWLVVASTSFERYGCGVWFVADLLLAAVTVRFEYANHMWQATWLMCRGVCIFVLSFWVISVSNPDHQSSGFWTGLLLQGSISWGSLCEIVHGEDMKGHSLEIWFVEPRPSRLQGIEPLIILTGALGL